MTALKGVCPGLWLWLWLWSLSLTGALGGATWALAADPSPRVPAFTATYRVYARGVPLGRGEFALHYDADRYTLSTDLVPTGLATWFFSDSVQQVASGTLRHGIPRPDYYRRQRTGNKPRQVVMDFQWDRFTVQARRDDRRVTLTLVPRTVDPLSLHLLLMEDLLRGGAASRYTVVDDIDVEVFDVTFEGEETLDTPWGELETQHFRQQRPRSQRATHLWFAPQLDFLLVQFTQTRRGQQTMRLVISELEGRDKGQSPPATPGGSKTRH
ncbi:MAG: DUF3108 domain-containing protein [Candidatus Competibacterales bacterium]